MGITPKEDFTSCAYSEKPYKLGLILNKNSLMGERKTYKYFILYFKMKKRVVFSKGDQRKFINFLKDKTNLKWTELSRKLGVKEGTLSKSYKYELCNLPYDLFKKMAMLIGDSIKNLLKKYKCAVQEEKLIIGRKVFGEQKNNLNPININFTKINLDLDNKIIKYSKYDIEKNIILPNKITPELAEEIGMHYGDGFLSEKRYDYRLKGNPKDEKEYYLNYIKPLFAKLYNVNINLKESYQSFGFELYSKAIWEFKTKVIGIKPGQKYNIAFPEILKVNNVKILGAFLRGLFDTDGSLSFKTRYGYRKYYPVIEMSLTSKRVVKDVGDILIMLGFKPWISFNDKYGRIALYGIKSFKRFKELIGWSSQKNLNKINNWENRYPQLGN